MLTVIISGFVVLAIISILWMKGIVKLKKHHQNFKSEELLNWDNQIHTAGRDGWDDNLAHTENEI